MAVKPAPASVEINGPQLRERRKLAGHTLSSFAQLCAVTPSYLSLIERGDRPRVSPPVYARICDALGLDNRRELLRPATRSAA